MITGSIYSSGFRGLFVLDIFSFSLLSYSMELSFVIEPASEEIGEVCFLHRKYEQAVPNVAIIYFNGDYKSKVYANTVTFVESIDEDIIGVKSGEIDRYLEWNGKKVTVVLLPKYYIHPWKSVLVGVMESIEK